MLDYFQTPEVNTMALVTGFIKFVRGKRLVRNTNCMFCFLNNQIRSFSDASKTDTASKQVAAQGTENVERLRVRRTRASDVPRVLRFVREHASAVWPGMVAPPSDSNVMVCDYVSRALAQGHSMLAEQQEIRRGWSQIRGLAIGVCVCPWDPTTLEKWARCVTCTKSRRFMYFTAHCLRAPALHDKYKVHNILQIIMMVPKDTPRNAEVVQVLAKNAIQRGKDIGFPVLRFDVTNTNMAKSLEDLQLKKEWQLAYDILPEVTKDKTKNTLETPSSTVTTDTKKAKFSKEKSTAASNFVTVYTAFTQKEKRS